MTSEEAIQILNGIEEVRGDLPEDGLKIDEALIRAKEALEKQIPKKPIDGKSCPNCGKDMWMEEYKFCPDCGQRIDWTDGEG